MTDETLRGGFTPGGIERRGEAVVRPAGPWTPTVHRLLRHVADCGRVEAPVPVGFADDGRELLSFVAGEALLYPLPDWVWEERVLVSVARLVRGLHDSTESFEHRSDDVWQWPAHEPAEVVCHNDIAPYNMVFRDGEAVALIDFDTSSPGPRALDVAYAAYRFAPVAAPSNPDVPAFAREEQVARLVTFCEAYGIGARTVLEWLDVRLAEASARITTLGSAGDPRESEPLRLGHHLLYDRDREWARDLASLLPPE